MTTDALREVLLCEIEDGNRSFVRELLTYAKAKILGGKGVIAPLINGTLNGKTFQRALQMDPVHVAQACRLALQDDAGETVAATTLDFSGI